jgi:hypothetical protein
LKKLFLLAILMSSLSHADDIASRAAHQRSSAILKEISSGEKDLKKSVKYNDEKGYGTYVRGPLLRKIQWWRELKEKDPIDYAPYDTCISAALEFVRYGDSFWETPTLTRDRSREKNYAAYGHDLVACKSALKAHPLQPLN